MIFIRIQTKSEKELEKIARILLKKQLVIDVNIRRGIERLEYHNQSIIKTEISLLTAKSKSLLFPKIDTLLKKKYLDDMPEIYSLPIIHMDWEQSRKLAEDVIQV